MLTESIILDANKANFKKRPTDLGWDTIKIVGQDKNGGFYCIGWDKQATQEAQFLILDEELIFNECMHNNYFPVVK